MIQEPSPAQPDEVEQLLLNAQLRDELEPYFDESITCLRLEEVPTPVENEFLASMLAWERAPTLPISRWFQPELATPPPAQLSDERLHEVLWDVIRKLYSRRIALDFTDHLSDRQLYGVICRDILPAQEKQIENARHWLHWDCADAADNPDVWLRYYASDDERREWEETEITPLPPREEPPYKRNFPRKSL